MLYSMVPELQSYGQGIEQEVIDNGYVETFFGRRRRFPLSHLSRHRQRAYRQAKNFKIQSTSSDIVLGQIVEMDEPIRNELGGRILLTVHDSVGFLVKKEYASQLPDFMQHYGRDRVQQKYPWLPVPFPWDTLIGPSYGETQPLEKFLANHPFAPIPEGLIEENELLNELRDDAFIAA